MSLRTYDLTVLIALDRDSHRNERTIVPGSWVRHWLDSSSLGIALSRAWGSNDRPMQVSVLWSRCEQNASAYDRIISDEDWRRCLSAKEHLP